MQDAVEELSKMNFSYEQLVLELKQARQNAEQLAINLKRANDNLRELVFRDELTGLYNHRYFQEVIESELQKSVSIGLVSTDMANVEITRKALIDRSDQVLYKQNGMAETE